MVFGICLVVSGVCLVVSGACITVSGGVWCMSDGARPDFYLTDRILELAFLFPSFSRQSPSFSLRKNLENWHLWSDWGFAPKWPWLCWIRFTLFPTSAGALTNAGSPSICAFVANLVLSRFTGFWMYHFQPQQVQICCEIRLTFVAMYALLAVLFSAIHGDEWLFHDYDASAGLPTLAQGCQR